MVGIVAYFYYNNYKKPTNVTVETNPDIVVKKSKEKKNKKSKKVTFDKNVKYNTYRNDSSQSISSLLSDSFNSPFNCSDNGQNKIDVDSILSTLASPSSLSSPRSPISPRSPRSPRSPISTISPLPVTKNKTNIVASNYEQESPETIWDSSFGVPLMDKEEKKIFYKKIQDDHQDYQKSLGQFAKYQTDNSTLIKTDVTIDPFKPEKKSDCLKGRSVKEIYDEQVAGPKAIPKKIRSTTCSEIIYEDELEMNGGKIKGTNLFGFDSSDGYKTATFGNEF